MLLVVVLVVIICAILVFGDNVPGVDEAREEAEAAEGDVDDGVGGEDTALDPD